MSIKATSKWTAKLTLMLSAWFSLTSCTHFGVQDCGNSAGGPNAKDRVFAVRESRIRSSHWRMILADVPAAAARLAPYAAMAALAYEEDPLCRTRKPKLFRQEIRALRSYLESKRFPKATWKEVSDPTWIGVCEDNTGLFYRVWLQETEGALRVVISFRGTWGIKDSLKGNFHWITRLLPMNDQYKSLRTHVQRIIDHFNRIAAGRPGIDLQIYATGHSLGGGLAQHALYSFPRDIDQAFAFDPSPVTGYKDQSAAKQKAGCECFPPNTPREPRIFRVYDPREILSNIRIFHKIFFPPERHIQEVRFENAETHEMRSLAFYLIDKANSKNPSRYLMPWYSGTGVQHASGTSCTELFERAQENSCGLPSGKHFWNRCPK